MFYEIWNDCLKVGAMHADYLKLLSFAITGLYYFDNKVIKYAKSLKPSRRNEIEITDLLKKYLSNKKLSAEIIGRGGAWLDTGSIEDFYKTSNFVSSVENRQGYGS